ncbi:MAG: hypothetical protein ACPGVD_00570 [Flavobacteriales bacterium]
MSTIAENIKEFFSKKDKGEKVGEAPEGMCPVCWGHSEWDGEYYEIKKDKHLTPGEDKYDSFISKIVDKHVNNTHKHENVYQCKTCKIEIN